VSSSPERERHAGELAGRHEHFGSNGERGSDETAENADLWADGHLVGVDADHLGERRARALDLDIEVGRDTPPGLPCPQGCDAGLDGSPRRQTQGRCVQVDPLRLELSRGIGNRIRAAT
jgi:hypothetical protein